MDNASKPVFTYYDNGKMKSVIWFNKNDEIHREDGPAVINYFTNGKVHYQIYLVNNVRHRIDGPSYSRFDDVGFIKTQEYYKNNVRHRHNGPAILSKNSRRVHVNFFYNGVQYKSQVNKWIKDNNFNSWRGITEDDYNRMWFEIL